MATVECPSCGGLLPHGASGCPVCIEDTIARPLTPSSAFSAYKIIKELGKGGMGAVYLAEENETKHAVAIKIMSSKLGEDTRGRSRFEREAQTMSTIHHPNIVQFESFGEFSDQPYIIMEYVDGETLAQHIKRKGPLSLNEALGILKETIDALEAAWLKRIIHRDIKPSNILIDKSGRVRVADFGLAKPTAIDSENTLTEKGSVIGSPHYISPEQAEGKELDFRSDIYSLGIVLYEMLVGKRPFEGDTPLAIVVQHLNTPLPSPRQTRRSLPTSVVSLLQWMTRKDRSKRPASYAELGSEIDSILQRKREKRLPALLLAAAVVAFATTASIFFWPKAQIQPPTAIQKPATPPATVAETVPMVQVQMNVLPWAHLKITSLKEGIRLPSFSEEQMTTPANFSLPEGDYELILSNQTGSIKKNISVRSGASNSFVFQMPAYNAARTLAQIRGNR